MKKEVNVRVKEGRLGFRNEALEAVFCTHTLRMWNLDQPGYYRSLQLIKPLAILIAGFQNLHRSAYLSYPLLENPRAVIYGHVAEGSECSTPACSTYFFFFLI